MILACPLRNDRTHMDLCFWGRLDLNGQNAPDLVLAFSCWIFTTKKLGFVSCCAKAKTEWIVRKLVHWCHSMSYSHAMNISQICIQYSIYCMRVKCKYLWDFFKHTLYMLLMASTLWHCSIKTVTANHSSKDGLVHAHNPEPLEGTASSKAAKNSWQGLVTVLKRELLFKNCNFGGVDVTWVTRPVKNRIHFRIQDVSCSMVMIIYGLFMVICRVCF